MSEHAADDLTFASSGVAGTHYAKCWPCMLDVQHPGGWHTWADEEDVAHALKTGQPDPSDKVCGCDCRLREPEPEPVFDPDEVGLDAPCPECGEAAACGYDVEGRPMIHATWLADSDDEADA